MSKIDLEHKWLVSVGITWIDLRTVFKPDVRGSQFWIGVCHMTDRVMLWTPLDYEKPTMITTINVSPKEKYCEAAHYCVNFDCPLNKFMIEKFLDKFKDIGKESLGLPNKFGEEPLWFNDPLNEWYDYWAKIIQAANMKPEGGRIEFSESKFNSGIIT